MEETYPEREVRLHFYYCTPVAGTPEPIGCQEFRWVPVEELDRYDFPAADRPLIARLQSVTGP